MSQKSKNSPSSSAASVVHIGTPSSTEKRRIAAVGIASGPLPLLVLLFVQFCLSAVQAAHNSFLLLSTHPDMYRHVESRAAIQAVLILNLFWALSTVLALAGLLKDNAHLFLPNFCLSLLLLPYHGLLLTLLLLNSANFMPIFNSFLAFLALIGATLLEWHRIGKGVEDWRKNDF